MSTPLRVLAALALAAFLLPASAPSAQVSNLTLANRLSDGGFENTAPSYWASSGAGATWSSARARTPGRSLALSGAGAATWTMSEAVRNWTPRFPGTVDLTFGAFVWTEGVNTAPATDAERFQIVYTFRDAAGVDLLGAPLVLDLPQTAASTGGWTEVSTAALGSLVLPANAASATIVVRKGASASGTAYVDDFFVRTSSTEWTGDIFNANVDVPGGWYYWWDGFSSGGAWPTSQPFAMTATTAEAHTGSSSLRVEQLDANASETVAISERVPVTPGEPVLVSYWLKTVGNGSPATIGEGDNNVGLTALWYNQMASGSAGYGEMGGVDIRLNGEYNPDVIPLLPRQADNGWTQYAFVVNPRPGAVGMELRLRYWHAFTGVTYWDDVSVTHIGGSALVTAAEDVPGDGDAASARQTWLLPNVPNPAREATTVRFALPQAAEVTLEVYDLLGRRVALLLDGERLAANTHEVLFNASDLSGGTYVVVLRTDAHTEARTVVIAR